MGLDMQVISSEWLKNKRNLIILSAVIGSLILILILYLPLAKTIRTERLELNGLKRQLDMMKINLQAGQEGTARKKLIQKQEISGVIDAIAQEGKDLRINFKSINQKGINNIENQYAVLPVEMEIEAGYEELGSFFGALENLEASIVTIEGFKIWRDERILPKISASLVVDLYLTLD